MSDQTRNHCHPSQTVQSLVVGLGATGMSTMRHLKSKGCVFGAYDQQKPARDDSRWQEIENLVDKDQLFFGDQYEQAIAKANVIYLSPGIAPEVDWLQHAKREDALISGDLDLFAEDVEGTVIAITGSNGKSTVTTLVGLMLEEAGFKTAVGGNLGPPMLDLLQESADFYVLELSSFQLERSEGLRDHIACILNLSSDHLDRHGDMQNYRTQKQKIYAGARIAVYSRQDALTVPIESGALKAVTFGDNTTDRASEQEFRMVKLNNQLCGFIGQTQLFCQQETHLVGEHNMLNLLAACAISHSAGCDIESLRKVCKSFAGLPHRCQLIARINSVSFINDSKATNVGAAIGALQGLLGEESNGLHCALIAGGVSKDADFMPLIECCKQLGVTLILLGEAAEQIAKLAQEVRCLRAKDMTDAVCKGFDLVQPGGVVLLAPACASFDMYENYIERGEHFTDAVKALAVKSEVH